MRIVVGLLVRFLRHVPVLSRIETRTYARLEQLVLSATTFEASILNGLMFMPHADLVRSCIRDMRSYRVIDVAQPNESDLSTLERVGVNIDYVKRNTTLGDLENTRFQYDCLERGSVSANCPWCGRLLYSTHSILAAANSPIYYYFKCDDGVFLLGIGREVVGYSRIYIYLPARELVLLLGDPDWAWIGRWELDQLRAHVVSNHRAIGRYLRRVGERTVSILLDREQFAHHVWNQLPALMAIMERNLLKPGYSVVIASAPMGPIEAIFPELQDPHLGIMLVKKPMAELPRFAAKSDIFLLRAGSTKVTSAVVSRIRHHASAEYPSVVKMAENFRSNHHPIMWASIRTGNRTWISQVRGISALAVRLRAVYPQFGLIIDGFAVPEDQGSISSKIEDLIHDEQELSRQIIALSGLDGHILTNIGARLLHSVIYAQIVDCYLAHHGTIQNKMAWFSGKRGVVHSNRGVLSGIRGTLEHYAAFTSTEDGILPNYLSPECVTDVVGATSKVNLRWIDPIDNYDFESDAVFDDIKQIIEDNASYSCAMEELERPLSPNFTSVRRAPSGLGAK